MFRESLKKFLVSQTRVRRKLISGKFGMAGSVDGQAMMVRLVWLAWGRRLASEGMERILPSGVLPERWTLSLIPFTEEAVAAREAPCRDQPWILSLGSLAFWRNNQDYPSSI